MISELTRLEFESAQGRKSPMPYLVFRHINHFRAPLKLNLNLDLENYRKNLESFSKDELPFYSDYNELFENQKADK